MKPLKNKQFEKEMRCTLRELPYFGLRGNLASFHGQFNNNLSSSRKTKRNLEKMTSLYDLDLFNLNADVGNDINNSDSFAFIRSKYFSPHSFAEMKNNLSKNGIENSLSIFHNNIRSLNCNFQRNNLRPDFIPFLLTF